MKKEIRIEGMSCMHCKMRVEKALSSLDGASGVEVNLAEGKAYAEFSSDVSDAVITEAIDDAGYDVLEIK